MRISKATTLMIVGLVGQLAAQLIWLPPAAAATPPPGLDDASCLACHDGSKHIEVKVEDDEDEMRSLLAIPRDRYIKSVHGDMSCIDCHQEITDSKSPHEKNDIEKPNCVSCHEKLWDEAQKQGLTKEKARLGIVMQNAAAYDDSFHARRAPSNRYGVKAYCEDCHNTHFFNVPPEGTSKRTEWHLTVPQVCGETCHKDSLKEYLTSVHGKEVTVKHNPKAAVCVDCHTSHSISKVRRDPFKLLVTKQCGGCHQEEFKAYRDTYHGQINTLGYAYTAKCFDCHGSHKILGVDDPKSTINPKNRLETCQECHDGKKVPKATAGFLEFGPHANSHDFKRYPQMWIAAKFMHGLLLFVFSYFWAHSLLWWYREYKHRKEHTTQQHIRTDELLAGEHKQVRRFGLIWRIGHLVFAISVMMLILTGMTVFYSYTPWAPVIADAFGGPRMTGLVHRISAAIMLGIFFLHLIGVSINIFRNRKTFRWFGQDSLVPNWKDFRDAWGMFVWFVGKGPKPEFGRWTYWEKFDYWAVFWGMAVIGGSGMMLAFPAVTASIFPGWIFNVVMLVHGEEAFLAAVFLFTVHFFNNHFRPDKLPPPDIVMFTGTQSLEEFKRDHRMQYDRLVETGQLEKYLVDAPSKPMTIGSKILGIVLLTAGLGLLLIVATGFFGGYKP